MFTKMKIAIVLVGSLVCGVASAQGNVDTPNRGARAAVMKQKKIEKREAMLKKFDANKDGKLDKDERLAARKAKTAALFYRLDTDHNGSISLAELEHGKVGIKRGHARRFHQRGR